VANALSDVWSAVRSFHHAMHAFVSINAATLSPAEFFDPAFLGSLLAA
jgi:hypothetical protein